MTKTSTRSVSFAPVDQTEEVRAAEAALAPLRAQHAELEARIWRYGSIEQQAPTAFGSRPTEELNAQANINSWRAELARATVSLREAETALAKARASEREKIRREIAQRKSHAISLLTERLLAAREPNEVLRQLEIVEQDILGEPVTILNWSALARSDATFTSKLDEWLGLAGQHAVGDEPDAR